MHILKHFIFKVGLIWFRGFSIHSPAWGCIDNIAIPHTLGEMYVVLLFYPLRPH